MASQWTPSSAWLPQPSETSRRDVASTTRVGASQDIFSVLAEGPTGTTTTANLNAELPPSPAVLRGIAHRKRTYTAYYLILFNCFGVLLSFGPYLEFFYTRFSGQPGQGRPFSLLTLASLLGIQLFCTYGLVIFLGWLYQRGVKVPMAVAIALVIVSQILLTLLPKQPMEWQLLIQGAMIGISNGLLLVHGTLSLASHYKNNIPYASTTGALMGPLGGFVYTVVAYTCLQDSQFKKACYINAVISTVTLIPAWLWIKPSTFYPRSFPIFRPLKTTNYSPPKEQGGLTALILFKLGYVCLFFGLFTWPTFLPLMVASMPCPSWPTHGSIVLMVAFGIAALIAPLVTSQWNLRSNGPLNTFALATLLVGLGFLAPSQAPTFLTGAICAIPYGLGLGGIFGLYLRVTSVFLGDIEVGNHRDTVARVAMLMTLAGISATVGVVMTAVVVEMGDWGFQIAMLANGVVILFGAILLWVARWIKAGKKLWYCI